jgi:hypothetical protein
MRFFILLRNSETQKLRNSETQESIRIATLQ